MKFRMHWTFTILVIANVSLVWAIQSSSLRRSNSVPIPTSLSEAENLPETASPEAKREAKALPSSSAERRRMRKSMRRKMWRMMRKRARKIADSKRTKDSPKSGRGPPRMRGAPRGAVGGYLGRVGLETPGFLTRCKQCCSHIRKSYVALFPQLTECPSCPIKDDAEPSGKCPYVTYLGSSLNPEPCFYDRCNDLLTLNCYCHEL